MYTQNHNEVDVSSWSKIIAKPTRSLRVQKKLCLEIWESQEIEALFPKIWYRKISSLMKTSTISFLSMLSAIFFHVFYAIYFLPWTVLNGSLSMNPLICALMFTESSSNNLAFWLNVIEVSWKKKRAYFRSLFCENQNMKLNSCSLCAM